MVLWKGSIPFYKSWHASTSGVDFAEYNGFTFLYWKQFPLQKNVLKNLKLVSKEESLEH